LGRGREIDERLRLAGEAQRPAHAAPHEARRVVAQRQRPQHRLRPEMLVDVDGRRHALVNRFTSADE
jgi:hypothetical protein